MTRAEIWKSGKNINLEEITMMSVTFHRRAGLTALRRAVLKVIVLGAEKRVNSKLT